ncbi:hypothetical protein V8B97DRAFT_2010897 [Scleroderma yunnanense]
MAQNNSSQSYNSDPILQYKPPFAQSLPVQILTTGIVLTLTVVLLLHLIFTAQYHWPLARLNFVLQLTGVITLLASLIATLYVILRSTMQESEHWPYMLSYIAVDMPKMSSNSTLNSTDPTVLYQHQWSFAEMATWTAMNATTSVIIQITHVHFLTLLYPSDLEAKLIMFTLGPLAVISAVMQLLPLVAGPQSMTIAEDTRNVCNAALSLLFASALLIWGFVFNRRRAWRTDGGTAAFGVGSIILALISTVLNFVYIPKQDQYAWMPKLTWAVVLWQGFLGWWWWAGSGMGIREVEEMLVKEQKKQQKRKLKAQRRKEQKERAKTVWKGVTNALRPGVGGGARARKRRHKPESSDLSDGGGDPQSQGNTQPRAPRPQPSLGTIGTSGTLQGVSQWMYPIQAAQRWYARLRHDHFTAARLQAVERVERIHQVYGREVRRNSTRELGSQVVGWGLGSYGLREAERERMQELLEVGQREGPSGERSNDKWERQNGDADEDSESFVSSDEPTVHVGETGRDSVPLGRRVSERQRHNPPSSQQPPPLQQDTDDAAGSSMWWWGPLRKWRLQDSTTYR